MNEMIKIQIEIPAPPEGWGEVEFRHITREDEDSRFWTGREWVTPSRQGYKYPVARKLEPLWTPPPQWHALFGDCWFTRDLDGEIKLSKERPVQEKGYWSASDFIRFLPRNLSSEMMPPNDIPWHKCCFKIGEPKE